MGQKPITMENYKFPPQKYTVPEEDKLYLHCLGLHKGHEKDKGKVQVTF